MKTTLLVPTLNEVDGMGLIMPKVRRDWVDQILVVDGGSTDGTVERAKEMGYSVLAQRQKGLRYAYIEAIDSIEGDVVITFSPDGNSLPEHIPALVAKMREGYDMVIVSRYLAGARSEDDTLVTGFGNLFFTKLINLLHGGSYTDSFVMFRAWRKEIFRMLDLHKESSYRVEEALFFTLVGVEPLLSVRALKKRLKIAEIPGDEPARIGGMRKLQTIRWGSAYLYEVLREKFFWG